MLQSGVMETLTGTDQLATILAQEELDHIHRDKRALVAELHLLMETADQTARQLRHRSEMLLCLHAEEAELRAFMAADEPQEQEAA